MRRHKPRYMTEDVIAFIEPRAGSQTWAAIYDALAASQLPVPRDWYALMGMWNHRRSRLGREPAAHKGAYQTRAKTPPETPVPPRKCLRCQEQFRPGHRFNFLCKGCKTP